MWVISTNFHLIFSDCSWPQLQRTKKETTILKSPIVIILQSMASFQFLKLLYVLWYSNVRCMYICNYYVFLMNLPLYHHIMALSICIVFDLVYFVWPKYGYLCVFYFYLHGISLSIPSLFVYECPLRWSESLVGSIVGSFFFFLIHWAPLCFLIEEFNTFTFKVIIDRKFLPLPVFIYCFLVVL